MPFIFVSGIPDETEIPLLLQLRRDIVATAAREMGCKQSWVRVFFPEDKLPEPQVPEEGCRTIHVGLDTGLFHGKEFTDTTVVEVTDAIGRIIYDAFQGAEEVEVFVTDRNNFWKTILYPSINEFTFEGTTYPVIYNGISGEGPGVNCVSYTIVGDDFWDLAIVHVAPGCKTPLQRVLKGERTTEGYVSGRGVFALTSMSGKEEKNFMYGDPFQTDVEVGQLMQWEAEKDKSLTFFEVCCPPYEPGRYEDLK